MKGIAVNTNALVGIDVGYGNVKALAFDMATGDTTQIVMPVGAAPANRAAQAVDGGGVDVGEGALVEIDGETWVAGVHPLTLQNFSRPTHSRYPKTREYLALFYAALARLGVSRIPLLVTGLPVRQYIDGKENGEVTELRQRLQGIHYIARGKQVTIERVMVVPQPAGAYTDLLQSEPDLARRREVTTLVVDVGYYSTDWVLARDGRILNAHSSSVTDATSMIIEAAAAQISLANGGVRFSPARLEAAMRKGAATMALGSKEIDYRAFLSAAAADVGGRVVSEACSRLRSQPDMVDLVLIAGGGGSFVERMFHDNFSQSRIVLSQEPVMANVRGFLAIGRGAHDSLASRSA